MTDFMGRRSLSNPKPFEITCEHAQKVLKQKFEHPEEEVKDFAEAFFHVHFCEICKQNCNESIPNSALSN